MVNSAPSSHRKDLGSLNSNSHKCFGFVSALLSLGLGERRWEIKLEEVVHALILTSTLALKSGNC